jgi:hypothetical protein
VCGLRSTSGVSEGEGLDSNVNVATIKNTIHRGNDKAFFGLSKDGRPGGIAQAKSLRELGKDPIGVSVEPVEVECHGVNGGAAVVSIATTTATATGGSRLSPNPTKFQQK